jgi:VanZ family protein
VIANWLHAPVYGVLALACLLALPRVYNAWRVSWKGAVLVVGLCALAGLVDEWHQHHVPGRDASLPDLFTDVLGALGTVWSVDGVLRCARGAPWRMLLSLLASVLGAALATLLPRLWPDLWWL